MPKLAPKERKGGKSRWLGRNRKQSPLHFPLPWRGEAYLCIAAPHMLDTEAYTTFPNTENSSREQPPGQRTSAFSFLMSRPLVKHVIAMGTEE